MQQYPVCTNERGLKLLTEKTHFDCSMSIPCEYMEFYIDAEYPKAGYTGDTIFSFTTLETQEHQQSYLTVDELDLVYQIGGILGIT